MHSVLSDLQGQQATFAGTVHLIFQPAEEPMGDAKAMIEDGLFERFPMRPSVLRLLTKPA
jgi:metal-dependent amidase/aminoacylase/carboxypeptidase family protein